MWYCCFIVSSFSLFWSSHSKIVFCKICFHFKPNLLISTQTIPCLQGLHWDPSSWLWCNVWPCTQRLWCPSCSPWGILRGFKQSSFLLFNVCPTLGWLHPLRPLHCCGHLPRLGPWCRPHPICVQVLCIWSVCAVCTCVCGSTTFLHNMFMILGENISNSKDTSSVPWMCFQRLQKIWWFVFSALSWETPASTGSSFPRIRSYPPQKKVGRSTRWGFRKAKIGCIIFCWWCCMTHLSKVFYIKVLTGCCWTDDQWVW